MYRGTNHSDIELNITDVRGMTAFMYACFQGQKDVIKLLMDFSDRNIELNACLRGQKEVVKLLLDRSNIILILGIKSI